MLVSKARLHPSNTDNMYNKNLSFSCAYTPQDKKKMNDQPETIAE